MHSDWSKWLKCPCRNHVVFAFSIRFWHNSIALGRSDSAGPSHCLQYFSMYNRTCYEWPPSQKGTVFENKWRWLVICLVLWTGGDWRSREGTRPPWDELLIATSIVPMWYLHMQLSNTHPHRHTGMHVHNLKNFYTHVSIYFLLEILLFILFFFLFLLKIKQFEWSCQKLPIKRIVASDVTEIWKTSKSADLAGTVTFISTHPYRQKLQ